MSGMSQPSYLVLVLVLINLNDRIAYLLQLVCVIASH